MSDEGLSIKLLDIVTGDIASSILDKLKEQTSGSRIAVQIREDLKTDNLHSDIKKLVNESSILANSKLDLSSATIKVNLEVNKNQIIEWVISDQSKCIFDNELDKIIIQYIDYKKEKILLPRFYKNLFSYLSIKKDEYLSIETKTVLYKLSNIENKLDKNTEITKETLVLVRSVANAMNQTFSEELKEARRLLESFEIKSARTLALTIQNKIENGNNNQEKEELYKIISDSYLMNPNEQEKAKEWIIKLIEVTDIQETKQRRSALFFMLENKQKEAEKIVDTLLLSNTHEDHEYELKCNILYNQRNLNEGIDFIKKHIDDFTQSEYWLATFYILKNNFKEAINHAEKAIFRKNNFKNRRLLFNSKVYYIDKEFHDLSINKIQFNEIQILIKEADDLLSMLPNDMRIEKSDIITNKGILFYRLGQDEKALEAFNEAYLIYKFIPSLLKNRSILLRSSKPEEALESIDALLELTPNDKISKELKYDLLIKIDSTKAEYEIKKELLTNPSLSIQIHLIDSLFENKKNQEAEQILKKIECEYIEDIDLVLYKANLQLRKNNIENGIHLLELYINKAFGVKKHQLIHLLTNLYMKNGDKVSYKKAVLILEPFINPYIQSPFLSFYVKCLFDSEQFKKCLNISEKIIEIHGNIPIYINYIAVINKHFDNFTFAIHYYEILEKDHRYNTLEVKLDLAYCHFRLGNLEKANNIVEFSIENSLSQNKFILISNIYHQFGNSKKAVKYAYKAYTMDKDNENANQNFIEKVLFSRNYNLKLDEETIKSYQDCLKNFEKKFPDSKFIRQQKIPENPEDLKKFLYQMLIPSKNNAEKGREIYTKNKLPISMLSKGTTNNYIRTWKYLTLNKDLAIYGQLANDKTTEKEKWIAFTTTECIFDLHIILCLYELNLLDKVNWIFKKIYITQSIIDLLNDEVFTLNSSRKKDEGVIFLNENDQVQFIETSNVENEAKLKWIKELLFILKDNNYNFEIIGKAIEPEKNVRLENLLDGFDDVESDIIKIATYSRIVPAIGNSTMRELLNFEEFSVKSFGVCAIIKKLETTKTISINKYYDSLIYLHNINYKYIPFNINILHHVIRNNGFQINTEVVSIFSHFSYEYWEINSILRVLSEFIASIIKLNLPLNIQKKFTELSINMLFKRNDIHKYFTKEKFLNSQKETFETLKIPWGEKKKQIYINMFNNLDIENEYG